MCASVTAFKFSWNWDRSLKLSEQLQDEYGMCSAKYNHNLSTEPGSISLHIIHWHKCHAHHCHQHRSVSAGALHGFYSKSILLAEEFPLLFCNDCTSTNKLMQTNHIWAHQRNTTQKNTTIGKLKRREGLDTKNNTFKLELTWEGADINVVGGYSQDCPPRMQHNYTFWNYYCLVCEDSLEYDLIFVFPLNIIHYQHFRTF
jgi:hypothetical protein